MIVTGPIQALVESNERDQVIEELNKLSAFDAKCSALLDAVHRRQTALKKRLQILESAESWGEWLKANPLPELPAIAALVELPAELPDHVPF